MYMHRIELMGPEYVLMLGVWWAVAVVLTVVAMAIQRRVVRWQDRWRDPRAALQASLDG